MKFIFEGNTKSKPEAIGILTEDLLLDKTAANVKPSKYKIAIDFVEKIDGDYVVHLKENKSNLLNE